MVTDVFPYVIKHLQPKITKANRILKMSLDATES